MFVSVNLFCQQNLKIMRPKLKENVQNKIFPIQHIFSFSSIATHQLVPVRLKYLNFYLMPRANEVSSLLEHTQNLLSRNRFHIANSIPCLSPVFTLRIRLKCDLDHKPTWITLWHIRFY